MRCSGFEELLVESGVSASGLIEKVMTGKHYNWALNVHNLVLDRLLLHVLNQHMRIHWMKKQEAY